METIRGRSTLSYALTWCFMLSAGALPFLVACAPEQTEPRTVTEIRYVYSCPTNAAPAPTPSPVPTLVARPTPTPTPTPVYTAPPRPTVAAPPPPPPPPPPAPTVVSIGVTGPGCIIRGTSPIPKGTPIYDAPSGGRLIATFTGGFTPMTMSDIPPDPAIQRSKLQTRATEPSVRIDGYVDTTVVPVWSNRDIPIVAGSVWIASAQKLKITGASPGMVTVEMPIFGTNSQVARVRTSCDALALNRGTPIPQTVPGDGRGYLARAQDIDIFDSPGGSAVFTLRMATTDIKIFWSTETSDGFVHGKLRADVAIDGWIRKTDLNALPKGEMMDQYIPPETTVAGTQLVLESPPRIARAPRDIPIRFRRTESEAPIGYIEAGAEFYVFETMAGWTNILPTKAYILPSETNGFWIPASETPR